jgi:hypothetical protein
MMRLARVVPKMKLEDEDDVAFDMDTVIQFMDTEKYYWGEMLSSEAETDSAGSAEGDMGGWASN